MKKYRVILADPPWPQKHNYNARVDGEFLHYPLMTKTQLIDFGEKVKKISADDSVCLMWTTGEYLGFAVELLKHWGFEYRTMAFVWTKLTENGKLVFNYSPITCPSCEFVIRGVRGKDVPTKKRSIMQALVQKRTRHSAKPAEIRTRIEKLYGNVSRVELFAREKTHGWDVFGNEVDSDVRF